MIASTEAKTDQDTPAANASTAVEAEQGVPAIASTAGETEHGTPSAIASTAVETDILISKCCQNSMFYTIQNSDMHKLMLNYRITKCCSNASFDDCNN